MLIKGYTNYDAATKTGLGGTKICFDALTNGAIDFYPEYTGTG
ncbi:MAG: glycine betaine ABC transporter substrate-binding protein, partial [Mucilaginibacter sp.]